MLIIPPPTAIGRRGRLSKLFPHPRDALVLFDPVPHKYYVKFSGNPTDNWEIALRSATAIVHAPFDHFDADRAITGMQRSSKPWKDIYMNPDGTRKSREELKLIWSIGGEDASSNGTLMHATIEYYLNAIPPPILNGSRRSTMTIELIDDDLSEVDRNEIKERAMIMYQSTRQEALFRNVRTLIDVPAEMEREMSLFLRYHARRPIQPFATEMSLFGVFEVRGTMYKVVGQADLIELLRADPETKTLYLAIGDFKRSKKIKTDKSNGYGKGPVSCMVNQNHSHFCLQVNLYRLVMERFYNKWPIDGVEWNVVILETYLLVCHPDQEEALRIDIPRIKDEVILDVIAFGQEPAPPAPAPPAPKKRSRAEEQELIDMFNE
jgi:hypothetical protein